MKSSRRIASLIALAAWLAAGTALAAKDPVESQRPRKVSLRLTYQLGEISGEITTQLRLGPAWVTVGRSKGVVLLARLAPERAGAPEPGAEELVAVEGLLLQPESPDIVQFSPVIVTRAGLEGQVRGDWKSGKAELKAKVEGATR
jgi:hypothetical protein